MGPEAAETLSSGDRAHTRGLGARRSVDTRYCDGFAVDDSALHSAFSDCSRGSAELRIVLFIQGRL